MTNAPGAPQIAPPAKTPWVWAVRIAALASLLMIWTPFLLNAHSAIWLAPLLFQAPYLVILVALRRKTQKKGLGRAARWGLVTLALALCVLWAFVSDGRAVAWREIRYSGVFALTQVVIIAAAMKGYRTQRPEPGDTRRLVKSMLPPAVCAGIILAIFPFAARFLTSDFRSGNQASAVGALTKLNQCAARYSSDHPHQGYPSALVLVGPGGSNCLDAQVAAGNKSGYKFTYTPGVTDAEGHIKTYTINADPIKYGQTGDLSLFTDESGVIHLTRENRPATAKDRPILQ